MPIEPPLRGSGLFSTGHWIRLALVFLFAWLIWNWTETLECVVRFYTPLPFWDYWRVVEDLIRYPSSGLATFLRQHNDHRIIFPEIVFVLDMFVWRGRLILPLAVSFVCYFCTYLLLAATVFSDRRLSLAARWMAVLVAGIVIGWKGSAVFLATPFQLQWTMLELATAAAFTCLVRLSTTSRTSYLAAVIVSGVVATYSSANGMILWPLLVAAGVLIKLDRRKLVALAGAGAVSIGVFFIGYQFGESHFSNLLLHPFYTAGFVGSYLSMPFGEMKAPAFGAALGLVNLAIGVVLAIAAGRRALLASPQAIVFFGWYLFTLGTALMTAGARMHVGDSLFADAKTDRYLTVPLVNWGVLICALLWVSARRRWHVVRPEAIAAICLLLAGVGFLKLRWWFEHIGDLYANEQLAEVSVVDGLRDMSLEKIFPKPWLISASLDFLQQHRLSVFASHRMHWIGRPVDSFARITTRASSAEITYVFPVLGGLEVAGWADTSGERKEPEWVLFANERAQIAGFGRKLPAGFPNHLHSPNTPSSLGWVGFVNFQVKAQSYSAYLIDRSGLVPIAGSFLAPAISATNAAESDRVLPGIGWRGGPSWTLNGTPRDMEFGIAPTGRVYGSWSGSDNKTGQTRSSPFATPANGCIIVPVLHGPRVTGQSVEIHNADNDSVIVRAPMQEMDQQWEFWRFSIPSSVKRIQIVASDQGNGWGEWLAIADARTCR